MQIIPTLLEQTPQAISAQIVLLSSFYSSFQIDIVDGKFAQNKTTDAAGIAAYFMKNPLNDPLPVLDFHLMIQEYNKELDHVKALNKIIPIRNVLLHASLHPDYTALSSSFPYFTFGMVLNIEDDVARFLTSSLIDIIPVIQIMTVRVGFQGGAFVPYALNKIEQIRNRGFKGKIFLDGGINENTLPVIVSRKYLPSAVCIGSYLTKTTDLEKAVSFLKHTVGNSDIREKGG